MQSDHGARAVGSGVHLAARFGPQEMRQARVGIVGAGASGLATAHALKAAGYAHVTVLERSERVGGKCLTFHHEGRTFELGAVALSPAYRSVRRLMREVGVRPSPRMSGLHLDVDRGSASYLSPLFRRGRPVRSALAWMGLQAELLRHRELRRPGLAHASPELAAPFARWLRERGLGAAEDLVAPWVTALGYGYLEEVPTLYLLKYLPLIQAPICELLDVGYGGLWERVARRLDVRCGRHVRQVRRGTTVQVHTDREDFTFDVLVLACPLEEALHFLDATEEERRLFSRIRTYPYHVLAAFTEGLPGARWTFFPKHFAREHAGKPVFALRRWSGSDLRIFYTLAAPAGGLEESEAQLRETVGRLGGRVRGIHLRTTWRYFPHVTSEDVASGFYPALESLQGERSTYFTGEVMEFATVESVTTYARGLVSRFFT